MLECQNASACERLKRALYKLSEKLKSVQVRYKTRDARLCIIIFFTRLVTLSYPHLLLSSFKYFQVSSLPLRKDCNIVVWAVIYKLKTTNKQTDD